jgi:hypothetical protein
VACECRYAVSVLAGARVRGEPLSVTSRTSAVAAASRLAESQTLANGAVEEAYAAFVVGSATPLLLAAGVAAAPALQLGEAPLVCVLLLHSPWLFFRGNVLREC